LIAALAKTIAAVSRVRLHTLRIHKRQALYTTYIMVARRMQMYAAVFDVSCMYVSIVVWDELHPQCPALQLQPGLEMQPFKINAFAAAVPANRCMLK
jgi:hypothetical protein